MGRKPWCSASGKFCFTSGGFRRCQAISAGAIPAKSPVLLCVLCGNEFPNFLTTRSKEDRPEAYFSTNTSSPFSTLRSFTLLGSLS